MEIQDVVITEYRLKCTPLTENTSNLNNKVKKKGPNLWEKVIIFFRGLIFFYLQDLEMVTKFLIVLHPDARNVLFIQKCPGIR